MRKFILIVLTALILLTNCLCCFAEIETTVDEFDGTVTIKSTYEIMPFYNVTFGDYDGYVCLVFVRFAATMHYFDSIDIKINKRIYKLENIHHDGKIIDGVVRTSAVVFVGERGQRAIKDANKIQIRVYYTDKPSSTFKIPDSVLTEWKTILFK